MDNGAVQVAGCYYWDVSAPAVQDPRGQRWSLLSARGDRKSFPMFSYMGILPFFAHRSITSNRKCASANPLQDPIYARFEPCFLPAIAAIPAAVSLCVVTALLLLRLLTLYWRSPQWSINFIDEPKKQEEEALSDTRKWRSSLSTVLLLVFSIIGFALQLLTVFHPTFRTEMLFPAASWAAACLMTAIYRPSSTPGYLLILHISVFASQLAILLDGLSVVRTEHLPAVFVLVSSIGSIIIILLMPMRDPGLESGDISAVFSPPTSGLRTPEDNLTLWQWMTVSWMAPLISLGNLRQLNDDDVWFLGYEFQHRKLHDRFRELQGSVLARLLKANGLDLIIISALATIEQFASKVYEAA